MTSLADALTLIGQAAGLNPADLIAYAAEDTIGGRDRNGQGWWPAMSVHEAEGKVLYALVRALKPETLVEVGVASGGTTTHLLTALAANGSGHLHSYDIEPASGVKVPEHLRDRWTFAADDALTAPLPERADFVFEDGEHTYEFTRNILTRLKTLSPRILISHDYFSHEVYQGFGVKQGFDEVLPGAFGVKPDDAFTGLGVWVNPNPAPYPVPLTNEEIADAEMKYRESRADFDAHLAKELYDAQADADPIPAPKPKRTRKATKR
jgi:hypothetical protein